MSEYKGFILLEKSGIYGVIRAKDDARQFFGKNDDLSKVVKVISGDIYSVGEGMAEYFKEHTGKRPPVMPKEKVIDLIE